LFVFNEKQPAAAGFAALSMTNTLFQQPAKWDEREFVLRNQIRVMVWYGSLEGLPCRSPAKPLTDRLTFGADSSRQ